MQGDVFGAHAELVGHQLGDGGLQTLAVRAGAHEHVDVAVDLHPQHGRFGAERPHAHRRGLDVQSDAQTQVAALLSGLGLLGPEVVVADHLGGLLQGLVWGDRGFIRQPGGRLVGQVFGLEHVAAAQLEGVYADLAGHPVDHLFSGHALHLPRTPVGPSAACVGVHRAGSPAHRPHPIGPGKLHDGHGSWGGRPAQRVGAVVFELVQIGAQECAAFVQRHGYRNLLDAGVVGGQEVLPTVFNPLHRSGQELGGHQHRHVLSAHEHLLAETATHIAEVDHHLVLSDAQHPGAHKLDLMGALGGGPHLHHPGVRLPGGHDAPGLHGHVGLAVLVPGLGDDVGGIGKGLLLGRIGHGQIVGQVASQLGMDEVLRVGRGLVVHHRVERLELHLHQIEGILGDVAAVGHHHHIGVAHEAHVAVGQHVGRGGGRFGRMQRRPQRVVVLVQAGSGEHRVDPFQGLGCGGVEAGYGAPGQVAAPEGGVEHAGQHDVVYVAPVAGDQAGVFQPLDRLADIAGGGCGGHSPPPLSEAAAWRVAATMPW